jgi:hypothetical protein
MAGVGRVDAKCAQAQRRNHRDLRLSATADETQICYHLSMGRVYFRTETGMLYFVDSEFAPETDIIRAALKGMGDKLSVTQLYLDKHSVLKAAFRVHLTSQQARVVLVALRFCDFLVNVSTPIN